MIDYFHDECFGGTELSNKCLLIALYVYYFHLTQSKNFTRMMKSNKWLGKLVEKKLVKIKYEIEQEFGKNEDGHGHWNEIKFMMKYFSTYFPTKFKNACTTSKRPMVRFTHMNSNLELRIFPVYVLQYVRRDKNVSIEKNFSCGNDGIFPNVNPCILILKDGHYYNVWDYCSLFNEINCPTIRGGKCNKGSSERYKKRFCLCCMVSYSLEILHVCQGRCERCLGRVEDHLVNGENDETFCHKCERCFMNEFCFESHLIDKLNGEYSSYCKFLTTLKNCESCLLEFGSYSCRKHFGKQIQRRRMKKDDEDVLIGSTYSSSNNSEPQYVKCGFCSDFYLKGSSLHSCYLKKGDSIFGNASRRSSTIKSYNVFYYDTESRLENYYNCKIEHPDQFDGDDGRLIRERKQLRKAFFASDENGMNEYN